MMGLVFGISRFGPRYPKLFATASIATLYIILSEMDNMRLRVQDRLKRNQRHKGYLDYEVQQS